LHDEKKKKKKKKNVHHKTSAVQTPARVEKIRRSANIRAQSALILRIFKLFLCLHEKFFRAYFLERKFLEEDVVKF